MNYKVLFLTTLLIMCTNMYTQLRVGLSGGYTNNNLETSTLYRAFDKYTSESGFMVSVPVQYHFNNWFAVEADLSYIQKNYTWYRTRYFSGVYQTTTNGYIQLPLMAHFTYGGERLKFFTNLGGYAGYWANSKVKGAEMNPFDGNNLHYYNEKYAYESRRDNRIELGLLAGVGVEYTIYNNYTLFLKTDYYYGLSDLQKNYMINQIPRYNSTLAFQLGCLINIPDAFSKNKI